MPTGFERYTGLLEGAPCDFTPRIPILMQWAAEYIGSNYGAFASDHRVLVEANLACARRFGMDQVSTISDPYREAEGFGARITFVPDGVPRATAPLADARDLSNLPEPDPFTSGRMRDRLEAVRAFREAVGGRLSILGWVEGPAAEAADLRSPVNFLYDVLDDPEYAADLMDRCTETAIAFARAQIGLGADTIGIGDAIASQVSPRIYRSLILPREKRLVDAVHEAGAYVRLHICGNITHLLDGIAALGVDILDLDHMVDPAEARSKVGERVVLAGNLDPVGHVRDGRPESIRAAVLTCREAAGARYMAAAGCEIPAGTAPENLAALCYPIPCP